eukprot:g7295.t1
MFFAVRRSVGIALSRAPSAPRRLARALSSSSSVTDKVGPPLGPHAELRRDVKFLGRALGDAIRKTPDGGEETYETVERLRRLAKCWRAGGKTDGAERAQIVSLCAELPAERNREVARAFTHFLALANAAETNHRVRRGRQRELHSNVFGDAGVAGGAGGAGGRRRR